MNFRNSVPFLCAMILLRLLRGGDLYKKRYFGCQMIDFDTMTVENVSL